MLGKLLDRRYQVTQVLGAGGFGKTYLAQDTRRPGNPICVVKQLKPVSSEPGFLETARRLFNSEAETLEQLGNHDQIPRLLAYFEEDQEFYLAQEFIEGHTLTQELQPNQRWEENRVIDLLLEVLRILEFVHHHNVIHRDIKPDNIIRRQSDNKLVLVDFGAVKQIRTQLASVYGQQLSNTIAVGTPGYMASEQALGQPRPSSDIYALGIIGIQALTGLMPVSFQEDLSTGEIIWQQLVPVSRGLENVLTKMVRYHFKDRYQSAAETLQALQQLNASYSPTTPYAPAPRYPSINNVSNSGDRGRQPTYPASPSVNNTLPASPGAPFPKPVGASQPNQTSDSTSSGLFPMIGMAMVLAIATFGLTYAIRVGSFASLFTQRNTKDVVDKSHGTCKVVASGGGLNVRKGPKGEIVDTIERGTSVSLTGKEKNGWVEISSPKKGWVFNGEQYLDCTSPSQKSVETAVSPKPVQTPVSQKPVETPKPKPSTAPPKPVDNSSQTLAKAAEQYEKGALDQAIAAAKSIPANSPAYKDAQAKVKQWQDEWSATQEKYNRIQKALDEGRWDEVIGAATDPKFVQQSYWRDQLSKLIQEAQKRKAEAEANQQKPTPAESPVPQQSTTEQQKPQPTPSVTPSLAPTGENPKKLP
ncbi:MAG TPA: serine/threonine protein kinase [Cyanobacteria bacterium UBA8553]|nr:serine/threonine protein kinase [Cyanobacteria bacterium UBA8553]